MPRHHRKRLATALSWCVLLVSCGDDTSDTGTTTAGSTTTTGTGGAGTGGTGGAGGTGTSTGGSGGAGGGTPIDCPSYCASYESICPEHALYPATWCEALCDPSLGAVATGTRGDDAVNTLGCRVGKLEQAASASGAQRAALCEQAHLSGGDACGTFCDAYCALTAAVCSPANPDYGNGPPLYADEASCLMACQSMNTDVLPGVPQPDSLFGYGDTVQCRLHHAHVATVELASLHCGHASAESTNDTCSNTARPNWANYCAFALEHCTGADAVVQASDQAGCMAELDGFSPPFVDGPFGTFTDASGHTIGCMNYWIVQAPYNPQACANAHPVSGVCK